MSTASEHFQVAIVGTGFSGLGMAIRLKKVGRHDFVILERAGEIGGTWRDNSYPGCACDVQSHLYSFSFAPKPDWSRVFAPQPEIWDYLRQTAERYGLMPHIRWRCPMLEAAWDEPARQWQITTPEGTITAQVLVLGTGPLSEPALPAIPGLADFQGKLFHSARWDHKYDLTGKRVAVIGTGASAVQFIPKIQPQVGQLVLFQRTPPWIVPRMDRAIPGWQRTLFRLFPPAQRLWRTILYWQRELLGIDLLFYNPKRANVVEQLVLKYLKIQVRDPELRAKLTPSYAFGCKRILLSDDFYPALGQPNVELETGHIETISPNSILMAGGKEYPVDAIICGTGFHPTEPPLFNQVRGRNGLLLKDAWRNGMQAYLGAAVSGFPNMFLLIGPNTGLGHTSMVFMIESQITYILEALRTMQTRQISAFDVRPDIQGNYNKALQRRLEGTVWHSGCRSWYLDKQGHNTTLWPGFTFTFRHLTRHFNPAVYNLTPEVKATEPL